MIKTNVTLGAVALSAMTLLTVSNAKAQQLYGTAGSTLLENFDTLPSTGTTSPFTNNVTLLGLYAVVGPTTRIQPANILIDAGTSGTGGIHSYGATGSTERAIGSLASGNATNGGTIRYALQLQNTTGQTLTSFDLSYVGEQWRNGGATNANSLTFDFFVTASNANVVDATGYTAVSALNFTGPITGAPAAALDGNVAPNRVNISSTGNALTWNNNEYLWLRFSDVDDLGTDAGLAVDDLNFSANANPAATPEPSTFALIGVGIALMAIRRRKNRA